MQRTVTIASSAGGGATTLDQDAVVVVDVIRATTTAITAASHGRRCFPVADLAHARRLSRCLRLAKPLVLGEQGGEVPTDFDLDNSPAELARRADTERPIILLSSSGTRVLCGVSNRTAAVYLASLQNVDATAQFLTTAGYRNVRLIGAASLGEFREEDQLCCARLAEQLAAHGYTPSAETLPIVERWRGASTDAFVKSSKSVAFLRKVQRLDDLEFILEHVDDVASAYMLAGGEVVVAERADTGSRPS